MSLVDWGRLVMKKTGMGRWFSLLMTSVIAIGSMPAVPAASANSTALNIAKVQLEPSEINAERTVTVDVQIEGNEEGFLAAEFGIVYDSRLTLDSVVQGTALANLFAYADNPDSDYIWFSGAAGSKSASATKGRQPMMSLVFTLPEDYAAGDSYYIGYTWDGLDGKQAYWYSDKRVNDIDSVSGHSITGSISIPDPDAPQISASSLRMNQGETAQLELTNFTGTPLWYSDRGSIADVDNEGCVSAYSPGTATVYCIAGTVMLTCDVTVTKEYYYSVIGDSSIMLTDPENEVYLEYPSPQGTVVWMSTQSGIVKVVNGKLTGIKNGVAQIVATCNNVTYVRQVIVNFPDPEPTEDETLPFTTEPIAETVVPPVTDHVEPTVASVTDKTEYSSGDLNGDNKVGILDVIILNQNLMIGSPLDEGAKDAADVLEDGVINEADSLTIPKYVVELIPSLPVKPSA